jgi:hypothetical protein
MIFIIVFPHENSLLSDKASAELRFILEPENWSTGNEIVGKLGYSLDKFLLYCKTKMKRLEKPFQFIDVRNTIDAQDIDVHRCRQRYFDISL